MIGQALQIKNLTVRFGGLLAMADVSFTVGDKEVVGLIGPNGAGKTTAFNVITGFLRPTAGDVRYRDTSLIGLQAHDVAALGLVRTFQRTSVFQNNSVFENLLIGLHRQGRATLLDTLLALPRGRASERSLQDRAWELLELVGLQQRASETAGALPYGEQRLLGVALALAVSPSMLLLDEPVSGMNPSETHAFMKLIDKIRSRDTAILLVEHDMPMVMGVSDRIVVLNYGRIIAEGSPAEVQRNPEVIRAYLGQGSKRA